MPSSVPRSLTRGRTAVASPAALVLAAVALVASLLTAAPAQAATPAYVALGDSYSSGTGTGSYINDGTSCQRSVYAYPSLIATARGYALNFRACSGATVADVTNTQLGALSASTNVVTISVGGNDAGFADVLTECALPSWLSNCYGAISSAQSFINNTLPARLGTLYAAIRAAAPNAQVTVVGYPRLFNGRDCSWLTWFSSGEMSALNATADLLNSRMSAAAGAAGFSYANPTGIFIGHAVCDRQEWINNLSWSISESFHPKRVGHSSGYYPTVNPLVGLASRAAAPALTSAVLRTAARSAGSLAAQQRAYAAADRSIRPERVKVPNLSSHRAKVAARAYGVDLARRASVNRVDRRVARQQARHWAGRVIGLP